MPPWYRLLILPSSTLIGVGDNIGVHAAKIYLHSIRHACGRYFKIWYGPTAFTTSEFGRAAPHGTGAAKVRGEELVGGLQPGIEAKNKDTLTFIFRSGHTKLKK